MTNLQINKELIEKILKEMERDKILQQYYYFVGDDRLNKKEINYGKSRIKRLST